MKIRAKLKDVVIIGETDFERSQIEKLTLMVKKDPDATIKLDFDLSVGQVTNFQFIGKVGIEEWENRDHGEYDYEI